MAMSLTTDWSKIRYIMFVVFFISVLLASTVATGLSTSGKQKRQLFREHLLPEQGGKIPDSAWRPDRIILNRFNQNGLYSPDGYFLDQRHPEGHSFRRLQPNTIKIQTAPNNRHVAPPGQTNIPQTVDTTYLVRQPVDYVLIPPIYQNPHNLPALPYASLKILQQFKFNRGLRYSAKQNSWNEILGEELPSHKIFTEFAPYLRKLHESDLD